MGALAVLAVVAVLGTPSLPQPFGGDQAVYTYGASVLARGGVLYRDFWDIKQPGIYWFYELGGRLFGFDEVGIHLFELLYLLAFAAVLLATLRRELEHRWVALAAPIATVGAYYAVGGRWQLTQLEILVGFPLYLSIWLALRRGDGLGPRASFFLSGVAAAVATVFKLVLAPIPAACWLLAGWIYWRSDRRPFIRVVRDCWAPAAGGVALVLASVAAWFAARGALTELLWTAFRFPVLASAEVPRAPWSRLLTSLAWFGRQFGSWLALAALPLVSWRGIARERLTLGLYLWLFGGMGVIVLQSLSYWAYHFLLLVPPTGLLATRGLDALLARLQTEWRREPAVPVALLLFLAGIAAAPSLRLWRERAVEAAAAGWALRPPLRERYQRRIDADYARIWRETAFLRAGPHTDSAPGPIYVFGNPVYLYLARRAQALPIHGWSWEVFVQAQWDSLPAQLAKARPAYVYVTRTDADDIDRRAPAVERWLSQSYAVTRRDTLGTWYRRIR